MNRCTGAQRLKCRNASITEHCIVWIHAAVSDYISSNTKKLPRSTSVPLHLMLSTSHIAGCYWQVDSTYVETHGNQRPTVNRGQLSRSFITSLEYYSIIRIGDWQIRQMMADSMNDKYPHCAPPTTIRMKSQVFLSSIHIRSGVYSMPWHSRAGR